jgi:hypothetical protein
VICVAPRAIEYWLKNTPRPISVRWP